MKNNRVKKKEVNLCFKEIKLVYEMGRSKEIW